ncbi:porin family protein [Altibacter sp. HG106]|uniref:porin family protein n=1 Tax=Altibacter sp. HG106 TaxID=3023937 RepID=UPI002350A6E1|nr:porin family protein [Altibacter sp. HG106]MDC7994742.1 porin family protein [Altibacter sp. HG106]
MQKYKLIWLLSTLFLLVPFFCSAQEEEDEDVIPIAERDSLYREDQFYFSATYNLILNVPSNVNLRGLSGGINFGYLRDMPLNQRRNVALAVGAGVSFNRYGQNLFIGEDQNENTIFQVVDENEIPYDFNRFSTATVEMPIEFRWRTSTSKSFKFWRIYGGIKLGYTYWYKARFMQPGNDVVQTDIPEFNPFHIGATLSFGYSTFNIRAYYQITPFFEDAQVASGASVAFRTLRLGIIFYIL